MVPFNDEFLFSFHFYSYYLFLICFKKPYSYLNSNFLFLHLD